MSLENNQIKLSIHLEPEFGWSIEGEPAFGPGSVLQGRVELEILDLELIDKIERLRLVFHGSERSRNKVTGLGLRRRQFFGVQRTLWEKSKNPTLTLSTQYIYSFTLQFPMVQFPPSIKTDLYRSYCMLSVFLDGTDSLAEREVLYRPFLETCLFKTPLVKSINDQATVSTHALDYVPEDTIRMDLILSNETNFHLIHMELVQTMICGDVTNQQTIAESFPTGTPLALTIPPATPPSFSYSDIASVNYKLVISLKEKKKSGISTLWAGSTKATLELPIRIGTLGYGIRASEQLQVYSVFQSSFDPLDHPPRPSLPLPVFVRNVEYEESLPLYESDRLPTYYETLSASDCDSPTATA